MEYAGNSNLKDFIEKHNQKYIKQDDINNIIKQICKGLKYIHAHGIIHRDLKPDNIFINEKNNIKIGDFGISKNSPYAYSCTGSFKYMSPEMIKGIKYNYKVDLYALGCIIYELFTLNKYYIDKRIDEKDCRIDTDIYNPKWQELIDLLLKKDYHERPDIEEVYNMIKDY